MRSLHWGGVFVAAFGLVWSAAAVTAQENRTRLPSPDVSVQPPQPGLPSPETTAGDQEGFEVLTRGPVHEAFAEQYQADPIEGEVIDRSPPELIDEIAPEVMPEGENVEWIPGYWSWDEDLEDFLWVSGLWRDVPPGQRWVPGSWTQVGSGYQWVSGFWTTTEVEQLSYLPQAPPPSQEYGPNIASPGENYFWVPGCWVWENAYQWRPGYWAPVRPDWVWVPARYYCTPQGYLFTCGYWDYPPVSRGVLFSPVCVRRGWWGRPYRPRVVVSVGPLMVNLFVRQRHCHYYFGDYYGDVYARRGFQSWVMAPTIGRRGFGYDPLWSYYRFGQPRQFDRIFGWNQFNRFNPSARPAITYAEMRSRTKVTVNNVTINQTLVASLDDARRDRNWGTRFRDVDVSTRERITRDVNSLREFQTNRGRLAVENRDRDAGGRARADLTLPRWGNVTTGERGSRGRAGLDMQEQARLGRLPDTPQISRRDRNEGADRRPGGEDRRDGNRDASGRRDSFLNQDAPQLTGNAHREADQQRRQLDDRLRNFRTDRDQTARQGRDSNRGPSADSRRDRNPGTPDLTSGRGRGTRTSPGGREGTPQIRTDRTPGQNRGPGSADRGTPGRESSGTITPPGQRGTENGRRDPAQFGRGQSGRDGAGTSNPPTPTFERPSRNLTPPQSRDSSSRSGRSSSAPDFRGQPGSRSGGNPPAGSSGRILPDSSRSLPDQREGRSASRQSQSENPITIPSRQGTDRRLQQRGQQTPRSFDQLPNSGRNVGPRFQQSPSSRRSLTPPSSSGSSRSSAPGTRSGGSSSFRGSSQGVNPPSSSRRESGSLNRGSSGSFNRSGSFGSSRRGSSSGGGERESRGRSGRR